MLMKIQIFQLSAFHSNKTEVHHIFKQLRGIDVHLILEPFLVKVYKIEQSSRKLLEAILVS